MAKVICAQCAKSMATLECMSCHEPICKSCAVFLEDDDFHYWEENLKKFESKSFCNSCYQTDVWPLLQTYEQGLEKAKEVFIYDIGLGKETRLMKRKEKAIEVQDCSDKEEATMRLAFLAALAGHNTLLDVQLSSKKVRHAGYQTLIWSGKGIPTTLDEDKENKKLKK